MSWLRYPRWVFLFAAVAGNALASDALGLPAALATSSYRKAYPDGSSVEFWLNGVGQLHAYNRDMVMATNAAENPYVFESEVLSPFAQLKPGQSFTWRYDWYACNIGGDFPVVDCTALGVISEPLTVKVVAGKLQMCGRFGVFQPGRLDVVLLDSHGRRLAGVGARLAVTPHQPVVLATTYPVSDRAASVALRLTSVSGTADSELARAAIQKPSGTE